MAKIHKMYQLDQSKKSKSGSKITTTPTPAQLGWPAHYNHGIQTTIIQYYAS